MTFKLTREIELEPYRCYACNQWWAYETRTSPNRRRCPYCAQTDAVATNERREKAERSASALRGVIKRMKVHRG